MAEIRTFNSAKLFVETVIHPLIKNHSDSKIVTRLGALSVKEADEISPGQRTINRYNATKERIIFQQTLINEIEATVTINDTKSEIEMLKKLKQNLDELENQFDEHGDQIMVFEHTTNGKRPALQPIFGKINKFLDSLYVQIQKIMTKNKLLFTSDNEDYLEDQELKEKIKRDNIVS